jgi:hypothetical protein
MPFLDTEKRDVPDRLKILLYGETGTGKSYLASSLPQPGYLLNFDDCETDYSKPNMQWWVTPEIYNKQTPIQQRWMLLRQDLNKLQSGKIGDVEFKSLVLDSTTSLSRLALEHALALNKSRGPDGGPIWNVHRSMAKNLVEEVIGNVLAFPGIVCVIGHPEIVKHELTGEIKGQLNLPGKLTVEVPSMFDEVWITTATKTKEGIAYEVSFVPTGFYRARSRLKGYFASNAESAPNNWQEIVKILKGE